jgi:hypothetical protein
MRRVLASRVSILAGVVVVLGLVVPFGASKVRAAGPVEYTWTLAALGQDGWIGGPLFDDGSVGGGGAFSADNGRLLANFHPTVWTEDASENITVCFDITIHKGPDDALPPSLCVGPAAVTGTPVRIELLGEDHIFRITEVRVH